jgi:hypothetical protein
MAQLGAWAASARRERSAHVVVAAPAIVRGMRWRARAKVLALAIIGALVVVFATAGALPFVARLALAFRVGRAARSSSHSSDSISASPRPEQPGVAGARISVGSASRCSRA